LLMGATPLGSEKWKVKSQCSRFIWKFQML
jgi:hypothetical protein